MYVRVFGNLKVFQGKRQLVAYATRYGSYFLSCYFSFVFSLDNLRKYIVQAIDC